MVLSWMSSGCLRHSRRFARRLRNLFGMQLWYLPRRTDTANMQLRQTLIIHWETEHCDNSGEFARVRMRLSPIRVRRWTSGTKSFAMDRPSSCVPSRRGASIPLRGYSSSRRISRNISPPTPPLGTFVYCLASRRNKNAPSTIKRTFGNQTSSSGCTFGFARNVSPMMTKRK